MAPAEADAQARVILIDEGRLPAVVRGVAVAPVACQNDDVESVARSDGPLDRYGVDDASVEHRFAVDIRDGAYVGQAARSPCQLDETLRVARLGEVAGSARAAIRRDDLEHLSAPEVRLEIERQQLVRHPVVDGLLVKDAVLLPQVAEADVVEPVEHVDICLLRAATLAADIGQPVARPGRHADAISEVDAPVEQVVEHAAGEDAAHPAALQYKSGFVVDDHSEGKKWNKCSVF